MNSLAFTSAAALAAMCVPAQQESPCGPYRVSLVAETELVGTGWFPFYMALCDATLAPDPTDPSGSRRFGFLRLDPGPSIATTTHAVRWSPGGFPNQTSLIGVTMPAQIEDIAIGPRPDPNGLMTVVVHRNVQFASGTVREIVLSKIDPITAVPSNEVSVRSFPNLSTSTPALGRIRGQDVLFSQLPGVGLVAEDIDTDPASPTYGALTNQRVLAVPGAVSIRNPTPVPGPDGETRSLLWVRGSFLGATIEFVDTAEPAALPTSGAQVYTLATLPFGSLVESIAVIDPATFVVVRQNAVPLRMQVVSSSSGPAELGQTSTFDVRVPATLNPASSSLCLALLTLAGTTPPTPLAGTGILGDLCLDPAGLVIQAQIVDGGLATFNLTVPNDPAWIGTIVSTQAAGAELGASTIYLGNVGHLEVVN